MLKEKSDILEHQNKFINFIQSLRSLDVHLLRTSISEGKWSIIEIVAHFYPWDEFVLQNRIPYLLAGDTLPPGPRVDVLNSQSSILARTESVQNTFEKCISIRTELANTLSEIPDDNWLIELKINKATLTLYEYFKGLMEHDLHHINQIKSAFYNQL